MKHRWMYPTRVGVLVTAVVVALSGVVYLGIHEPPTKSVPQLRFTETAQEFAHSTLPLTRDSHAPSAEAVRAALDGVWSDADLGTLSALVVDARTGQRLDARSPDTSLIPASLTKLVTAAAVLTTMEPTQRLQTRVVAGETPGEVVLIASGDVTLADSGLRLYGPAAASIEDLAAQVRDARGDAPLTRVRVDSSLFSGSSVNPHWDDDSVSGGYVAPVAPVMLNGGRTSRQSVQRVSEPDVYAGQRLAAALGAADIPVERGTASRNAELLGSVSSPAISTLTEWMLRESNNTLAEVLARLAAKAYGHEASNDGVAVALPAILADLGVTDASSVILRDGSGLSRANHFAPTTAVSLLQKAVVEEDSPLRWLFAGLPIAAFDGTLDDRFSPQNGAGQVRAKTGTLSKVVGLAGVAVTQSGYPLVFAFISNGAAGARDPLDRAAGALTLLE